MKTCIPRTASALHAHRLAVGLAVTICVFAAWMPASAARAGSANWSSATAISGTNQPDPTRGSQLNAVAMNASGLTLAWDQFTYTGSGSATIGAAIQAGGRWGAPFTVSGAGGFSTTPSVAVGADGTMAVSWTYQDPVTTTPSPQQKVQVAVKPASATAWTTYTLAQTSIGGVATTTFVPVAFDAAGNLTAAWTYWDGARHLVQSAVLRSGSSAWQPTVTVSGPLDDGLYFSLAVNAGGDAAIAYTLSPYTSYATGTSARFASRNGADGTWTMPVTISETMSSSVGYITSPQVALDANRQATVIYMGYGIEAVRQLADMTWTAPQTVLRAPNAVSSYVSADLAADVAGNAVVTASIFDATINVDRASVWVARGTPDGNWTAQLRITDPAVPVDAYATRAAMSPDGTLAMVGWIDHYHGTVQVSKWTGTAWSAADTIGRGTAFSSFQEVLVLDAASGTSARAIWKSSAKGGTRTMAASYR
jgi:hypothetical protein